MNPLEQVLLGWNALGAAARMHRHIDPAQWLGSVKFAVCRNPYDRLFSGWAYCRRKGRLAVPFEYFVKHMETFQEFFVDWHCVIPQLQHLMIDGVPVVDHVCRFEQLDSDFDVIRTRLGRPALCLPHLNRSADGQYREHYTPELQDIVFERFAADFEYFGYGYDLGAC